MKMLVCRFGRGRGDGMELFDDPSSVEEEVYISRSSSDGPPSPSTGILSFREKQVLTMLAIGENNQTIATKLSLSPETVRNYTRTARMKLGAKSRTHAIAIAAITGQLDRDSILQAGREG